jgi:hypothetical protein
VRFFTSSTFSLCMVTLKIKIISDDSYVIGTFSSAIVNKVVWILSFRFYKVKKRFIIVLKLF